MTADLGTIWEAVTTTDWITLYGSQTGTGSGSVTYRLAENNTGVVRSGRIIIGGELIEVTRPCDLVALLRVIVIQLTRASLS